MEDKRREAGSTSPAPTISATTTTLKSGESHSPSTEPPAPRRRGQKRKSSLTGTSSSAPPKRHAREKAAAAAAVAAAGGMSSFLAPIHNGPLTRARQLSDNHAISSAINAALKNEKNSSMVAQDEAREEVNLAKQKYEALEAVIEAEFERIRSRDANAHVVPVAAGWFSWTNINPLEKQSLPSFFNGKSESRTPEIYMEIRNWIMKKFHANPSMNIELKDLSALSVGDSDAKQEVMEFLDHWGLINYHPFPPSDPVNTDADTNTDVDKADKIESLIEKLYQFENEESYPQIVPRANMSSLSMPTGLFHESAIAEELAKQEGPSVEYHCNSCGGDCSRKRYHCQKQADFDLCTECYNNGKFGTGMSPSDFILMEPAEASGASGGKWTDQETLLLLEALELYKENWNEIAEHVATKTKAQCILHFLQMPIEDSFLDYDDTKDGIQEITEAVSVNNDVSAPNDDSKPSEGKTGEDNSEPAENASDKQISESEPLESKIGKDDTEKSESKMDTDTAQTVSTLTEPTNLDTEVGKVAEDKDDDFVLKALKEAFDAVGCPLVPDNKLSFADTGNPVISLAAFLTRLVEPDVATASARCSIKSMSRNSSGSLLAARHCFLLEDPPGDKKDEVGSKSMASERIDQNGDKECKNDKEINHNEGNSTIQREEKSTSLSDGTHSTDIQMNEKGSTSGEDPELPSGSQDLRPEKTQVLDRLDEDKSPTAEKSHDQKSDGVDKPAKEKAQVAEKPAEEKAQVTEKPAEEKAQVAEKPAEEKAQVAEKPDEEKSQVAKKPDEGKSQIVKKPNEEKSKIVEKPDETDSEQARVKVSNEPQNPPMQRAHSPTDPNNEDDSASKIKSSSSANESANLNAAGEAAQCAEAPKDVDMESSAVVSDKAEPQEKVLPDPVVEVGSKTGDDKMEIDKSGDSKSGETTETKEDPNVTKLKRAAVATLSAAAVKAKLLVKQEEDEIRQLATLLIEKQLRKLEIKLSFFTEMDSAIMRVREQLERSRQKLFSERAQIIASRLGLSASSSRGLPSSFPMNRMPPNLLNSMMRPPMSMAVQRPPMPRPVMTTVAPPPTNASAPVDVAGGESTQHSASENPSSVGAN